MSGFFISKYVVLVLYMELYVSCMKKSARMGGYIKGFIEASDYPERVSQQGVFYEKHN